MHYKSLVKDSTVIPNVLLKPEHLQYFHMIDYLARRFGQCIHYIADNYTRYDFWVTFLNDTYNNLQESYIINKK